MSRRLPIASLICLILLVSNGHIPNAVWAQDTFYSVHVGSFKKADNAARQVADFQAGGYYAISRRESVDGKGEWHRVYVGRHAYYDEARQLGRLLMNQGLISSYTVREVDLTVTVASSVPLPYTPETARRQAYGQPSEPATQYQWPLPNQMPANAQSRSLPYPPQNQGPVMRVQACPQVYYPQQTVVYEAENTNMIRPVEEETGSNSFFSFNPRFLLGARIGLTQWNHPGDFVIIQNNGGSAATWNQTSATGFHIAVVPSIDFNRYFSLEHSIERASASEWGLWTLSLDPKVNMPFTDTIAGYMKLGMVWGSFSWEEAPGDFDSEFGWQIGSGVNYDFGKYRAGLGLLYRDIQFTYNSPGGNVWSTRDTIDMSSFSISGTFDYKF